MAVLVFKTHYLSSVLRRVTGLSSAACASEAERPSRVWLPARWWGSSPVVAGATTLASREGLLPGGGAGWPAFTCSESSERRLTMAGRQLTVISGGQLAIATSRTTHGWWGPACPGNRKILGPDETLEGQPVTGSTWERPSLHVYAWGLSGAPQKLHFFPFWWAY